MADSWNPLTPQTFAVDEIVSAAKLNQELRDRIQALFNGLVGDGSADLDVVHRHKSGTFAARPAAGSAGRLYRATDTGAIFWDDVTAWRHLSGRGFYDGFDRADSTTLGSAESGHAWTESVGNAEIVTKTLRAITDSIATIDSGALLETAHFMATFDTGSVAGNVDLGLVLRFVDSNNYLFCHQLAATNQFLLKKVVAGVATTLASSSYTAPASTTHYIEVFLRGNLVICRITNAVGVPQAQLQADVVPDPVTPFATATRCGARLFNEGVTGDVLHGLNVVFNV